MLKLSTKSRYGFRLMLDLAKEYGKGPVSLKEVAKRQGISEKYLWQLINPLKNAGLVNAVRGSHGGYLLNKPPRQISLKDIMEVLEGSMCLVECTKNPSSCKRASACISREVWTEASVGIMKTFESFNLESIVQKEEDKKVNSNYCI